MSIRHRLDTLEGFLMKVNGGVLHGAWRRFRMTGELPEHPPTARLIGRLHQACETIDREVEHDH